MKAMGKETEKQTEKRTATVKSADRVLDIFELFAERHEAMSLSDIARELELPASSTHKLLQNLLARGYLETDRQGKTFRLGSKLFEIGSKYAQRTDLSGEFQYVAQKIVDDLNESVFLTIRNGDKALYIAEKQSTHPVRFVSHLGMQLPLHSTAMGKVLLSGLQQHEIDKLYPDKQLGRLTESTITSFDELSRQLERIRAEGVAYSFGESVHGIRCAAAPIYGASQSIVAALGISVPESRVDDALWDRVVQAVRQGAKEISAKLFYAK